jgi:hypothetical protein
VLCGPLWWSLHRGSLTSVLEPLNKLAADRILRLVWCLWWLDVSKSSRFTLQTLY